MAVTDDAISQIKQMIQRGELRPGDRLPPEHELGVRLGLSRNSLREAVKALEAMRVLDVRRGDGTYVTSLELPLLLESVSFAFDYHHSSDVLDALEVRWILESAAARASAWRATAEDLERIRIELSGVDRAVGIERLVEHDMAFHRVIAQSSGNAHLASLVETVSNRTVRARVWRGLTEVRAVERTLHEHHQIFDAIEQRDVELAGSLMTVHVRGVEQWLRSQLDDPDARHSM